jgi:hypothetical protein
MSTPPPGCTRRCRRTASTSTGTCSYIVRSGRLAEMSPDELRDYLTSVLRAILLG